jgi:hypothetical protein
VAAVVRLTLAVAWAAEGAVQPGLAVAWPAVTRVAAGAADVPDIEVVGVAVVAAAAWGCGLEAAAAAEEVAEPAGNGTLCCWTGCMSATDCTGNERLFTSP